MKKEIILYVDLEKLRYSLVGNGYLSEEVEAMSEKELVDVLDDRICMYIEKEYQTSKRYM